MDFGAKNPGLLQSVTSETLARTPLSMRPWMVFSSDDSKCSDPNNDNIEINRDKEREDNYARMLLTNASSLKPKMNSLVDAFDSLTLNFACITETWYQGGKALKDHMIEVEGANGIRILQKNRDGRLKKRGGVVAIAFNTANCNFKQRNLTHMKKEHEVICAVGKIGKIDRKVVIFLVYVPPNTRAAETEALKEALTAEVAAVKVAYKNPILFVAGDFDHRDVAGAVSLAEQVGQVQTGPTRGNSTIDVVYSNVQDSIIESLTLPPLQDISGRDRDHRCVYVTAAFKATHNFTWEVKKRRLRDQRREDASASEFKEADWSSLAETQSADGKWGVVEHVIKTLTDKHFPMVRVRKRSNESPWITRAIRRLWKKKVRIYKKEGRSQSWWDTDWIVQQKIETSQVEFVKKKLEEGTSGRSFYKVTKKLAKAAVVRQWSVKDLYVGRQALQSSPKRLRERC